MYVLTAIAHKPIDTSTYLQLTRLVETLPIKVTSIAELSKNRCFDFFFNPIRPDSFTTASEVESQIQLVKESIFDWDLQSQIDIVIQKTDHRQKRLFVFDMDSTLIYQEVIELIAAYAGVEQQVEAITTAAMNGELDFKQSLAQRVALLRGIDGRIWDELKLKLQFTRGDFRLMRFLKAKGCTLAVLSGGFQELANYVKQKLGLDYAFANNLETELIDGKLCFNGKTTGEVVDGQRKAELLKQIAACENIPLADAMAVGDGANDLIMMATAGFGVAWNAKEKVQRLAPCRLNTDDISDILYILGYSDQEIEATVPPQTGAEY